MKGTGLSSETFTVLASPLLHFPSFWQQSICCLQLLLSLFKRELRGELNVSENFPLSLTTAAVKEPKVTLHSLRLGAQGELILTCPLSPWVCPQNEPRGWMIKLIIVWLGFQSWTQYRELPGHKIQFYIHLFKKHKDAEVVRLCQYKVT